MNYDILKEHTLNKIINSSIDKLPFHHLFITDILDKQLYSSLKEKSKFYNDKKYIMGRCQDNKLFINHKFPIINSSDETLKLFYKLFADNEIKTALVNKFFINSKEFIDKISIFDKECEFVYTEANKFQSIHVDIPSKFVSLVFYLPNDDDNLDDETQLKNGTILYDKHINPVYKSRYIPNSVCIFAQHFYSYHGFDTTIPRNALVMFYVHSDFIAEDLKPSPEKKSEIENKIFKQSIFNKLKIYKLIEYNDKDLNQEHKKCKINNNKGRVVI